MKNNPLLPASIVLAAFILAGTWLYVSGPVVKSEPAAVAEETILPPEGVELPVSWGDLGAQLLATGVIDRQKFDALYNGRGGLSEKERVLLEEESVQRLRITPENAPFFLNLFWALGLGNKNTILEKGEMTNPEYGGAGNFASTGGWTLAKGDAMDHYSAHPFIMLSREHQELVERVSKGIYRPCCNNSTHFPDCNHGMAMLGLLELMASQGVSEEDMYKTALVVNAYWFPDTYLTIARYLAAQGVKWEDADPKKLLGAEYSSGSGYQQILTHVAPLEGGSGGGCSV